MSLLTRTVSAFLLAGALQSSAFALDELVPFGSAEGLSRFTRAAAKSDFAPLANQFEAQATIAFCGPTSAAIVLNALQPQNLNAPRDPSRLLPTDSQYLPKNRQLTVPRHTQESVIATGKKTRAQVFGEPLTLNGKTVRDGGYQLRQLDDTLKAHPLATRLVIVDDTLTEDAIRQDLVTNLNRAGDFVIVNYRREVVGQAGGGHISPLGAYDAASDSVLVMDVNPSHYPWVWMPLTTLIRGMRTRDAVENRGYILVQPR